MDMYLIIFVIVAFMGIAVWWFWRMRYRQANAIASIVTISGVLGTFVGIAWGLWNFDPDTIEESVPKLLAGLKVAFFTSILGIFGSICLRWLNLQNQRKETGGSSGATIDDLADLLKDILEVEKHEGEETRESLKSIEKSLTGEGDSTVLTQLQKLRTTFADKQDDLVRAFNEFAEKMADNNTQALIQALEEVMRDFNAKINEQFGDNFRQLNDAVGKINEWQEQYRQQMVELAEEFRIAAASVEQSRQSLTVIADRSDALVSIGEQLEPILQALQHEIGQLDTHLEAFSSLADNASNAFPIIETRLNQLTGEFSAVVSQSIDKSHASMEKQREALAKQSQILEAAVENTGNHIQQQIKDLFQRTSERVEQVIADAFQDYRSTLEDQAEQLRLAINNTNKGLEDTLRDQSTRLKTMTTEFSTAVQKAIEDSHTAMESQRKALEHVTGEVDSYVQRLSREIQDLLEKSSTETERFIRGNSARVTEQMQQLDAALEQQLKNSIESLGSQLTSLSGKFVADYDPLTEKLQRVVHIANRLEG